MKQSLLSYLITSLRGMFTSTNTSAGKHTNKEANNCPPPFASTNNQQRRIASAKRRITNTSLQGYENGITFLRALLTRCGQLLHGCFPTLEQQNGITFSRLSLTRCALLVALILGSVNVWGQETLVLDFEGSGTFPYNSAWTNTEGALNTTYNHTVSGTNACQANSKGFSIQTKDKIDGTIKSITYYATKTSTNTTSTTMYIQTSENGTTWTTQGEFNIASTTKGTWTEVTTGDISNKNLKNVYVRVSRNNTGSSTAVRLIDDITITYESTTAPAKTLSYIIATEVNNTFTVGDEFLKNTITAYYTDGTYAEVTDDCSFTGYDMSKTGSQTVYVSYTEGSIKRETNYTITVNSSSTPSLKADKSSIDFGSIEAGGRFTAQTVTITGANLTTAPEYVIIDGPFEVSGSGKLPLTGGDITITCTATTTGAYTGSLYISSGTDLDCTVNLSAEIVAKPTITWHVNGTETSKQYSLNAQPIYNNGTDPTASDCDREKVFVGWTTSEITVATNDKPTVLYSSAQLPAVSGDATYYAVFAKEGTGGSAPTAYTAGDEGNFVLAAKNDNKYYAIPTNPTVSSGKITGVEITTATSGSVTYVDAANANGYTWTIADATNGQTISDGTKYLYHANGGGSGTNLTYGTGTTYTWTIESETNGLTFKGTNGTTVNSRGLLCSTPNTFGGYSLSNEDNTSYARIVVLPIGSSVSYEGYITQCCTKLETPTFTNGQDDVTSNKTNEVTLAWTGDDYTGTGNSYTVIVYDENEVEVKRATDVKTTSCTIDGLSPATAYYWTVQAIGGEGYCNSDVSEQAYAKTACTPNTLAFSNGECYYGDLFDLSTLKTAGNSSEKITYTCANTQIDGVYFMADVSETPYTVTATQAAGGGVCGAEVTFTVLVKEKEGTDPTASFAAESVSKTFGDAAFTNTFTSNSGGALTYSSSKTTVATVSGTGEVTIVGVGETTITVHQDEYTDTENGNKKYNSITKSYTLKVNPKALATPTNLAASDVTQTTATLSWTGDANATGYEVTILDGNGETVAAENITVDVTNANASVTGLTHSTTYTWSVKALGEGNYANSTESDDAEFTTDLIPTYTVTWSYNDTEVEAGAWSSAEENKQVTALPDYIVNESVSNGRVFKGWLAGTIDGELPTAPEGLFTTVEGSPVITKATTFYAVFATKTTLNEGETEGWTEAEIGDINETDVVAITFKNATATYAMSNDQGTSEAPNAVKFTATGNNFTTADNIKWNISNNAGELTIYPMGVTDKWLYCYNNNNGVRVGTGEDNIFIIEGTYGYLYNNGQKRYVGVYNSQDFRCYTTTPNDNNIKEQTLAFYKYSPGEQIEYSGYVTTSIEKTTTPTISLEDGTYTGTQEVTISCTDADATIYYTTNGSDPRNKANTIVSGSTVTIKESCTLRVIAQKGSLSFSDEVTAEYTIKRIYNITWMNNGKEFHSATVNSDEALTDLPASDPTAPIGCYEKEFMGWATSEILDPSPIAPTLFATAEITTPTGTEDNITYYAVFADATLTGEYEDATAELDLNASGQITTCTTDELTFTNSPVVLTSTKLSGTTGANNYCPCSSTIRTSTRFYSNLKVVISAGGAELKTITITATSDDYAKVFGNTEKWTNATETSVNKTTATITLTAGATSVTFTPSGTCGAEKISVTYNRAVKDYSAYTTQCDASGDIEIHTGTTATVTTTETIEHLTVHAGAKLEVTNGATLNVASITLRSEGDKVAQLIIPSGNQLVTNATTLNFVKHISNDRYYFFSLPFECNISDITVDGAAAAMNSNILIKYYDGAARANNGGTETNWKTVTGTTLKPGVGYEVAVASETAVDIVFPLALGHGRMHEHENTTKEFDYAANNTGKYASDGRQCGWNLMGTAHFSNHDASCWGEMYVTTYDGAYVSKKANTNGLALSPFSAFFIQAGEDGSLAFSKTSPAGIAARHAQAQDAKRTYVGVSLSNGIKTDETTLVIGNQFTQDYEIGADLEKMLTLGTKPQVYTVEGANQYAFKAINEQDASRTNMLGVYLPAEGEYTFALMEEYDNSEVKAVYLTDYETGMSIDLMQSPYTFTNAQEHTTTRFAISAMLAPQIATDLTNANTTSWTAWQDAPLHVRIVGIHAGDRVRVIDATGRLVCERVTAGISSEVNVPQAGVYCIETIGAAGLQVRKVVVR